MNVLVRTTGGWWNDLDMIEIGNGGSADNATDATAAAASTTMYPWAVAPADAGAGWALNANGSVTNGGICLTANFGEVDLEDCTAAKASERSWLQHTPTALP